MNEDRRRAIEKAKNHLLFARHMAKGNQCDLCDMLEQAISDMEAQAKIVTCGECEFSFEKELSTSFNGLCCLITSKFVNRDGYCNNGKRKEKTDGV